MENNTICKTISEMALRVAKEVDIAGYTGLGIHEETLSDLVLNRIRYEYADNFLTRKFTRKEEGSVTGADWLWCIGEPGSWITFAVQAKIVNVDTGRVNYLHYRKGEQHDLLINFCRQFRFIPKYSIYGKIDDQIDIFARRLDDLKDIPKVPIPNVSIFSTSPIQQVLEAEMKKIENRRQWKVFPGVFERLIWHIQDRNNRFLLP